MTRAASGISRTCCQSCCGSRGDFIQYVHLIMMQRLAPFFAMAVGLLRPIKQENIAAAVRRGGLVVDGSGLENRQSASSRGFESHPLRRDYSYEVRIRVAVLNEFGTGRFECRSTGGAR